MSDERRAVTKMAHNSKRDSRARGNGEAARHFRSFRWVGSPAEYGAAARQAGLGRVPVLAPAEPQRVKRWEEILRWYGLEPDAGGDAATPPTNDADASPASDATIPAANVEADGTDLVVGFGDEFRPAAEFFAAAKGRRLVVASAEDPLRLFRDGLRAASVVFVGRPESVRKENLHAFARSLEIPWGVLTARDLPAISFVVAKQLAGSRAKEGGAVLLDAPAERIRVAGHAAQDAGYSLTDGDSLSGLLTAEEFTHMVVHAHGEGAHANLKSAVLCGLLGAAESWRGGGALPDGCRQERSKRFCKRASRQRRHIFSFGDLKAENLYLLSCNGYTTAEELYPSDVSAVLSAAEGYPASVVTTDRSLGIATRIPDLAFRLSGEGAGPSAVCRALNEVMMFRNGVRPFVLCGDPLASGSDAEADLADGELALGAREAVRLIDLKSWEASTVIGLAKDPAEVALFRGEAVGALLSDAKGRRRFKVEDLSARWRAERDRAVTFARRQQRMSRTAALIKDFWWEKYREHADLREQLEELEAIGRKLLAATQRSFRGLENVRCEGVWDARISLLCDAVERHAGQWDECFARIVEGHILDCDLAPLLLHDSLQTNNDSGLRCQRCGMGLALTEATDYVEGRVTAAATDCPNCGPQELWQTDGVRFVIKGGAEMHPGKPYTFAVEEKRAGEPEASEPTAPYFEPPAAYVVAQFQDLGGKPFFGEVATARNGKARFKFSVPPACSHDMQTLRVAWIQGLTVSAWRLQYACVPAAKRKGEAPARGRGKGAAA